MLGLSLKPVPFLEKAYNFDFKGSAKEVCITELVRSSFPGDRASPCELMKVM